MTGQGSCAPRGSMDNGKYIHKNQVWICIHSGRMENYSSCSLKNMNRYVFCPQINFPMCTIASMPRLPEHCIEYARILQWPREKPFGGNASR